MTRADRAMRERRRTFCCWCCARAALPRGRHAKALGLRELAEFLWKALPLGSESTFRWISDCKDDIASLASLVRAPAQLADDRRPRVRAVPPIRKPSLRPVQFASFMKLKNNVSFCDV
jgi:hypothetical protein